jgi:hypothetical protein
LSLWRCAGVWLAALAAALSNSSAVTRIMSLRHVSFDRAAHLRQYPARAKSISERASSRGSSFLLITRYLLSSDLRRQQRSVAVCLAAETKQKAHSKKKHRHNPMVTERGPHRRASVSHRHLVAHPRGSTKVILRTHRGPRARGRTIAWQSGLSPRKNGSPHNPIGLSNRELF